MRGSLSFTYSGNYIIIMVKLPLNLIELIVIPCVQGFLFCFHPSHSGGISVSRVCVGIYVSSGMFVLVFNY